MAFPLSRQPSRRRLFAMLAVTMLLFSVVIGRLTQLQVFASQRYDAIGESQRIHSIKLAADRGTIFDRGGHDLALSVPQETIWADPKEVKDVYQTAAVLAPVLNSDLGSLQKKLAVNGSFVYVAREVDDNTANRVKALGLAGIHMYDEPKRFLPGDSMLSSVIGHVGTDNEGLSGLELQYDKQLKGQPGTMTAEQDPTGKDIPGGLLREQPARPGDDLMLTIDQDLQFKVEQSLSQEIQLSNAKGGMAAMMDTQTGEVLALANLTASKGLTASKANPTASPNNVALTNVYEPGSVSKLITLSAALESGVVSPSSSFSVPDHLRVADATFTDADSHPVENWTTTDILSASSNIGTIGIAQKLGKDRLDHYQRAFGYGAPTGLKFPGESQGLILDPKHYSGTSLATTAIGQGVSVTAMQMLAAYNTIANGGTYVAPKLVAATIDSAGKQHPTPPSPTREVVSPQTAAQMNLMLQEVVRVGTATAAQIDGYSVAGKTGTARKPKEGGGGYQDGAYISSFAGFVPANNPRLTGIVILDQPTPIFGGLVAAPVFSDIARYGLQEQQIPPGPSLPDRHGVPFAAASASSAASESDAPAGTTADSAKAATASANAGKAPLAGATSTTSAPSVSTTAPPAVLRRTPQPVTSPGAAATGQ